MRDKCRSKNIRKNMNYAPFFKCAFKIGEKLSIYIFLNGVSLEKKQEFTF